MLSFVIPALNEADGIERCVGSIGTHLPADLPYEVVVVDNGSTDDTRVLASRAGASVIVSDARTIAATRNAGVAHTKGDVLVFLDADCTLTREWGREIDRVLPILRDRPLCCAGSQVFPPAGESVFLWTYWFLPFVTQATAAHIGSANMVCLRKSFDAIDGFDPALETGEDYDFCARLKAAGGSVLNTPALRAEHYGFPRTFRDFIRRERWHGRGDVGSLRLFVSSRVAVVSVLFVLALVSAPIALLLGHETGALVAFAVASALLLGTSVVKFRHAGFAVLAASTLILPAYFLGRAMSAVDALGWKAKEVH